MKVHMRRQIIASSRWPAHSPPIFAVFLDNDCAGRIVRIAEIYHIQFVGRNVSGTILRCANYILILRPVLCLCRYTQVHRICDANQIVTRENITDISVSSCSIADKDFTFVDVNSTSLYLKNILPDAKKL